ncbi:hypothetical protein OU415_32600 [Saccharopolyspora sp. WRP15-2]|uniref:Uncharacterized protein n=1 Tax=Saccharopolyspora oryzae TaxID=2997343 RepID=A0ABT4V8A8_9PSEU|nr:hypothetical protein [Saccharopolyspora oryzae]MDA3630208.1 hypothetical protein [Saccharopolyspora oryzae]
MREGIERFGVAVADVVSGGDDSGATPPRVVYFGQSPQARIVRALEASCKPDTELMWVLTTHRLGLLEVLAPEVDEDSGGSLWSKARKFGAGVKDFSRDVADIFQGKQLGEFAADTPIPVREVTAHVEFPAQLVRSVAATKRKLPSDYRPRKVFPLRIELDDGSGLEVIAQTEEAVARLQAMAFGRA